MKLTHLPYLLMDLHSALEGVDNSDQTASRETSSPLQALKRLNETVTEALLAYLRDQPEQASQYLSSALPQLLVAMTTLGLDPASSPPSLDLEQVTEAQRLIHIIGNRVEVRVDDEIRGSWSIWSVADLREVCRLAEEFDCGLVYSFLGGLSPSRTDFTNATLFPSTPSHSSADVSSTSSTNHSQSKPCCTDPVESESMNC